MGSQYLFVNFQNGTWQWYNASTYFNKKTVSGETFTETIQWLDGSATTVMESNIHTYTVLDYDTTDLSYVAANAAWIPINPVYATSILMVPNEYDKLRFVPNEGYYGSSFIILFGWDQTEGVPGETADVLASIASNPNTSFSAASMTMSINVLNVNRQPVFKGTIYQRTYYMPLTLRNITSTVLTSEALYSYFYNQGLIVDRDGPLRGIAIYAQNNVGVGEWQYTTNYTNAFPRWRALATSQTNALSIETSAATAFRFRPNNTNSGYPSIQFLLWDGTQATFAPFDPIYQQKTSAYSIESGTIQLFVASDQYLSPEQTNAPPAFTLNPGIAIEYAMLVPATITNSMNTGVTLQTLYNTITLYMTNAADIQLGIAVYQSSIVGGVWEVDVTNTGNWVAIQTNISTDNALILDDISNQSTTRIRYRPIVNRSIVDTLQIKLMNTANVGLLNNSYRSLASLTNIIGTSDLYINATLEKANTPPVISPGNLQFLIDTVNENSSTQGVSISDLVSLIQPYVFSFFPTTTGIAIRSFDNSAGKWQVNGGVEWLDISGLNGSQVIAYKNSATTRIRFLPSQNTYGTSSIFFSAWDQDILTEGVITDITTEVNKSISINSVEGITAILAVNNPPIIIGTQTIVMNIVRQDIQAIYNIGITTANIIQQLGSNYFDIDADRPGFKRGIAIDTASVVGLESQGQWQYKLSNKVSWNTLTYSADNPYIPLPELDTLSIRFQPFSNIYGIFSLTFVIWDQTAGIPYIANSAATLNSTNSISAATATLQQQVLQQIYVPTIFTSGDQVEQINVLGYN